ncbi:MAG: exonuclease domain-containing protein [Chloroflexia bacterium]
MEVVRDLPLHGHTYAVVDVETTGLSVRTGDRICEVAVVLARGGQIVDQLQTLVNPQKPISRGASAVNGITDSMVRKSPTFRQVAPALVEALEGAVLVAHNAPFDISFISAELRGAGFQPPSNPVVDTLALSRRFYSFSSNKLGDVARELGIRTHGLHRALADATITWHVLKSFLRDFQEAGITTLAELIARQGALTPPSGFYSTPALMEWDGGSEFCPIQGLPPMIERAMRAQAAMWIRYEGSNGRLSERLVQPLKVTLREQATYLVAYCHLRKEERTFRLDKMQVLEIREAVG